ncbi:hypothetical protein F5B22DRAFT_655173 [Xylaria bambusicola]|uniref:uncharacterized protein n=1 Tax=Xylaria bambusicola TaxID=326684 RepID=UPI002008060F|nr:uncharacterized protein F5B22DRAFT_655173 [Xylaria bambusicola]KAI0517146.1 hypothetical protein F5B22DRAFT_655173 [Xylaria bambusicola]
MSSVPTVKSVNKVIPRPSTFLSLAPETSASYPTAQDIKPALHPRRSSSVSSAGSAPSLRVLKLGPVHYGEHPDEHKEDFHEVAVEEALEYQIHSSSQIPLPLMRVRTLHCGGERRQGSLGEATTRDLAFPWQTGIPLSASRGILALFEQTGKCVQSLLPYTA